jgi:hypothetical protein
MSRERDVRGPDGPDGSAFHDALVGLIRACQWLDALVAQVPERDGAAAAREQDPSAPLDAILGLFSLRKTIGLFLEALLKAESADQPAPSPQAPWPGGVLR